jgi:hypothetical protein
MPVIYGLEPSGLLPVLSLLIRDNNLEILNAPRAHYR